MIKGICICHRGHSLLRKIYHVTYDQIGFLINNKMWLYWNLPTNIMHYIGSLDFPIIGVKVFQSSIRDKYNKDLFIETLESIPQEESSLITILRTIGITFSIPKIDIMGVMDIFLSIFQPPHLEYEDNTPTKPVCQDLITMVCNYPPSFPHEELLSLSHNILDKIKQKNPIIPYHYISKLAELLGEEPPVKQENVFIIHDDGILKENLLNARRRLTLLLQGNLSERSINIKEFIHLLNYILSSYGEEQIPYIKHPYSILISCGDDVIIADDYKMSLSLAGDNADKLTKDEIERLLYLMDEIGYNNGEFDTLRSILVKRLYNFLEGETKEIYKHEELDK